jgi:hypothetical protein
VVCSIDISWHTEMIFSTGNVVVCSIDISWHTEMIFSTGNVVASLTKSTYVYMIYV